MAEQIPHCESCGASEESLLHSLFECPWTKPLWQEMKTMPDIKLPIFHRNLWSMDMIDNTTISEREITLILCRR
jgi:hypothetical protein